MKHSLVPAGTFSQPTLRENRSTSAISALIPFFHQYYTFKVGIPWPTYF